MAARARWLLSFVRDCETALMERWLHIDTISRLETRERKQDRANDGYWYESFSYSVVRRYVKALHPGPQDCAYDVGCGAGRVLAVMARMNMRKVVGIELVPELAEQARENLRRLRGRRCPVEVYTGDAAEMDCGDATIYVLCNPFGEVTLRRVLERIYTSVTEYPRVVRFAYLNPAHEQVFLDSGWLTCIGRRSCFGVRTQASYWSNARRAEVPRPKADRLVVGVR